MWCGRSCVRSGMGRDSRLRDCSDFPRLKSRERENGGRGSTTIHCNNAQIGALGDKTFEALPSIVRAPRDGMRIRGNASPPWLICDNRWNEAPPTALGGCCSPKCVRRPASRFHHHRANSLISTSSNGSFVNSTKFLE